MTAVPLFFFLIKVWGAGDFLKIPRIFTLGIFFFAFTKGKISVIL